MPDCPSGWSKIKSPSNDCMGGGSQEEGNRKARKTGISSQRVYERNAELPCYSKVAHCGLSEEGKTISKGKGSGRQERGKFRETPIHVIPIEKRGS